jgi:hypothetical protein
MKKYIRDYEYKGELTRLRAGRYEYVLNERKYHIRSLPWITYGCWEARSGGFFDSANTLSTVVWNIDRRDKR